MRFSRVVLTLALLVLGGCARGAPLAGLLVSPRSHRPASAISTQARPPGPVDDSVRTAVAPGDPSSTDEDDDPEDDVEEGPDASVLMADAPGDESGSRVRRSVREEDEPLEDGGEDSVGWRDGVGEGRPWPVPFSVDHFQGLLVQVGVSPEVLPEDGSTLSPEQAVQRMSPRSRAFQHQVTKSPAGWVYRVWRNGEKADFDGFDLEQRLLKETKGLGYDKHFKANLEPKDYFRGAKRLVKQAQRQYRVAGGVSIRWHVAEPRMVDILKKLFKANDVVGIDVVYTPPSL
ncbi:hypothetical protein BO221_41010 [Archangium sp. Cb G35]|nr:hypothetical protein BO221_41010 [Archangium sp. Cb G35]